MQSFKVLSMRLIGGLVILSSVTALGYTWYQVAYSKCRVPIFYDIGTVDERFDIETDTIKSALTDAESLWEDATGKNLFTYKKDASLKVNFVYDERQRTTNEQHSLTEVLDAKAEMSETIKSDYNALISSYETLKNTYEANVASYEKKLAAHNADVERWNKKGGAPADVYEDLKATGSKLNTESAKLNSLAEDLNDLAGKINQVGERGNQAVLEYNKDVETFNSKFHKEAEFTQGDYQGDSINVYQYDDQNELRRVLAHEFGHALSLEHIAREDAIMHNVMEGKHEGYSLTTEDIAEYQRVCGTR